MKNVYIYNKALELIATPYITNEEEFIENPKRFYPDYLEEHYYSFTKLINPVIDGNELREMTRAERVGAGQEELQEGEYIEDEEIKYKEKPNDFHFWNNKKNEWVYDQKLEKSSLEEEIGNLEGELSGLYDELDKAVARKLKMREKQLNEEIEKLNEKIENKYKRYEELEG